MNKSLIIIIVIAVIILALGGFFIFFKKPVPEQPLQKSETFYLSGKVLIKKRLVAEWEEAERDMAVEDGDIITTFDKSTVEIKFGKGQKNFMAVKDNTTVKLKSIEKVGDKQIEVEKGNLILLLEELDEDSKFELRAPTAVCGVLGTGFKTEANPNVCVVKVFEGEVHTRGIGIMGIVLTKEVVVREGSMTRIEKHKAPEDPTPLTGEDLKKWHEWRGDLDSHLFRTFYVFLDEGSSQNHYHPSGWIGDYDAIRRVSWVRKPHSGKNCLRFKYTARLTQGAGWAGVYWQNPVNNWGDVEGGYNLKGAKKLTFWARGEKGGETIVRFGMGGIGGIYTDTAKAEIGPIVLEKGWRQYSIDLSGKDLSYISGGFFWMTDKVSNPDGAVFYIDEIRYK